MHENTTRFIHTQNLKLKNPKTDNHSWDTIGIDLLLEMCGETFREQSIDAKLKLLNADRLTANVFHM